MNIEQRAQIPGAKFKSLLELVTLVDNVPLDFITNHKPYYRLFFAPDPRPHGYIHPRTIELMPWSSNFTIDQTNETVTLSPAAEGSSPAAWINSNLQQCVDAALETKHFPILSGQHSEYFRILGARGGGELVHVERFAGPLFGIASRGAHMTGYVRDAQTGTIKIWCAKRSKHLFSYPGYLDSTVAGGVKSTQSPTECITVEAMEEASLPESLISTACKATSVLTLANRSARTENFHSEVLYCYDLELPADVLPTPGDDEVESFVLLAPAEVMACMFRNEFKTNVCPVLVDFFIRHGLITPETEGEQAYVEVCSRLRRQLPVPLGPE